MLAPRPETIEADLALFLDAMAGSLANDLEWALAMLDDLKEYAPKSKDLAKRYVHAQQHLRTRRAYEKACASPKPEDVE